MKYTKIIRKDSKAISKFVPSFVLSELKQLPSEVQSHGKKIKMVYSAFSRIVPVLLDFQGYELVTPYPKFLNLMLIPSIAKFEEKQKELNKVEIKDHKYLWYVSSMVLILTAIRDGHWKIEEAFRFLKKGMLPEFSDRLAQAGVYYGRLAMVADLCHTGVFDRFGSIGNSIAGASLGGEKSGITRRANSRVPTPEKLRLEQQRLIDANKPKREIGAILAKKYDCTTDHIRKLLKRE